LPASAPTPLETPKPTPPREIVGKPAEPPMERAIETPVPRPGPPTLSPPPTPTPSPVPYPRPRPRTTPVPPPPSPPMEEGGETKE
jgi:hypothetical protein